MSICISYMVQNSVSTGTNMTLTTDQGGSGITDMNVTRFANVGLKDHVQHKHRPRWPVRSTGSASLGNVCSAGVALGVHPIVLVARAPFLEFGSRCILIIRGFQYTRTGVTGELR